MLTFTQYYIQNVRDTRLKLEITMLICWSVNQELLAKGGVDYIARSVQGIAYLTPNYGHGLRQLSVPKTGSSLAELEGIGSLASLRVIVTAFLQPQTSRRELWLYFPNE